MISEDTQGTEPLLLKMLLIIIIIIVNILFTFVWEGPAPPPPEIFCIDVEFQRLCSQSSYNIK